MRVAGPVVFACAFLAPWIASAQPGDPVETAVAYLVAASDMQCPKVWPLYSKGTQDSIRTEARRQEREREGASLELKPETMYCGLNVGGAKYRKRTARLVREQGNEAVVSAELEARLSRGRYDIMPPNKIWTEEIRLVREGGAWRVTRKVIRQGPDTKWVTEMWPVDVRYNEAPVPGMHSTIEATAVVRALGVAGVLTDPKRWAGAFSSVKTAESLGQVDGMERVRLTFTNDQSLTILVRPVSRSYDESTLAWDAEGGGKAEPYARGRWVIKSLPDGSRITLRLVYDPRPMPKGVGPDVFSPQRAAEALLALEKTAR